MRKSLVILALAPAVALSAPLPVPIGQCTLADLKPWVQWFLKPYEPLHTQGLFSAIPIPLDCGDDPFPNCTFPFSGPFGSRGLPFGKETLDRAKATLPDAPARQINRLEPPAEPGNEGLLPLERFLSRCSG